jgi:glutathione S-transferase
MKLIGSGTSPYVRRLQLLLARAGRDYQFSDLNIYGADREELKRQNPALKIPVLHDGETTLYDSRVIFRYLQHRLGLAALSWEQENQLTLIDAVNDSMVTLLLAQRSGLDVDADLLFFNLQRERIDTSLAALEALTGQGAFDDWSYPSICLFCLVDWALFRGLIAPGQYPQLEQWLERAQGGPGIAETDPRLAV